MPEKSDTMELSKRNLHETGVKNLNEKNGQVLCKAEYSRSNGMVYGEDITIQLTDKEIVYASFFPWEGTVNYDGDERDEIVIEHKPLEPAQWAEIERAVGAIYPLLKVIEECKPTPKVNGMCMSFGDFLNKITVPKADKIQVLDGGDRSEFRLTWRDENGMETTYRYYFINDRRFYTLLNILCETVHPTGRKIVWYGEPVVNGVYVYVGKPISGKDKDFSFDLSEKEKGIWRFYAYYGENEKPVYHYAEINEDIWARIFEKLKELDVERLKQGKRKDNSSLTLRYDDGKSAHFKPDERDLAELKELFLGIIAELKNK